MSFTYHFAKSGASLKDLCSNCEQIHEYLKFTKEISQLLKKFLMENVTFCAAYKTNM